MIWLGENRGYLSDWVTQRWVQATGRRVHFPDAPWLDGPVGDTRGIGRGVFEAHARRQGLEVVRNANGCGLLSSFEALSGPEFDPADVDPAVAGFYERTSDYELDAWSEWCGMFRPFGALLAVLFSRRLQQLNVPLSPLDTSRGISSEVYELRDPRTSVRVSAAWVRELVGTRHLLYAGSYSTEEVPGWRGPCVKVVFPLPNGNCIVLMKPSADGEGGLTVASSGERFGDPGFYFTVRHRGDAGWARYVRSLRETIRVYAAEPGIVRADHTLRIWGSVFLRLHYRLVSSGRDARRDFRSGGFEPYVR